MFKRESVHTLICKWANDFPTRKHNQSSRSLNNHTVKSQSRQLISAWLFTDYCSARVLLYTLLVAAWILLHHSDALLSLWIWRGCCVSHCEWRQKTLWNLKWVARVAELGSGEIQIESNFKPPPMSSPQYCRSFDFEFLVKWCHDIWFCSLSPDIYEVLFRTYQSNMILISNSTREKGKCGVHRSHEGSFWKSKKITLVMPLDCGSVFLELDLHHIVALSCTGLISLSLWLVTQHNKKVAAEQLPTVCFRRACKKHFHTPHMACFCPPAACTHVETPRWCRNNAKTDSETFSLFNKLTRFLKPFFNTYTDTPAIILKSHLTATLHQAHSCVLLSTTKDIFQAEKWTGEGQEAAWDSSVLKFISLYTLSPLSFSLYNLPSMCLELHVTSNKAI